MLRYGINATYINYRPTYIELYLSQCAFVTLV